MLTYVLLKADYAKLKAAKTAPLDDYQVGDMDFKPEDWLLKQYYGRKLQHQCALHCIYQPL